MGCTAAALQTAAIAAFDPTQTRRKRRPSGAIRSHRAMAAGIPRVPPSCILHAPFALPHHALRFQPVLRTARACRSMTHDQLCASIGLGSRRRVGLGFSGFKALDIYRLGQIEVSIDRLLGRSDVMEPPQGEKRKRA